MSGFLKAGSGKREVGLKLNLWAGFGMGGERDWSRDSQHVQLLSIKILN